MTAEVETCGIPLRSLPRVAHATEVPGRDQPITKGIKAEAESKRGRDVG
jgi:hypothetical protein